MIVKPSSGALDFVKWKEVDVTKGSRQAFEDFWSKKLTMTNDTSARRQLKKNYFWNTRLL